MASFAALRRAAATAGLLPRFTDQLRPVCHAPSIARSFNTSAQMKRYEEDDDDMRDVDVGRRRGDRMVPRGPGFFADVFDPFAPTRSLSQVLNLVDQLSESPFLAASRGIRTGARRGWDAKEDADALHLRMDMPGLGKEHVKVSVEDNTLTIKGEGEKESEEDEDAAGRRRYSSRIGLPPNLYKVGEIKAEMKNGVLKVVVPKVKVEEERRDVFHVNIE